MEGKIIKTLSEKLQKRKEVLFAYLFGSRVSGKADSHSDYDIAVYLDTDDLDTRLSLIVDLSRTIGGEVDLLVLNKAKNLYLLDELLRKNILLKDHELRQDFEWKKEHEILDFKAFKRMIDAA